MFCIFLMAELKLIFASCANEFTPALPLASSARPFSLIVCTMSLASALRVAFRSVTYCSEPNPRAENLAMRLSIHARILAAILRNFLGDCAATSFQNDGLSNESPRRSAMISRRRLISLPVKLILSRYLSTSLRSGDTISYKS